MDMPLRERASDLLALAAGRAHLVFLAALDVLKHSI